MNIPIADTSSGQKINKSFIWGLKALLKGEITGSRGVNGAVPSSSYWTTVSSSDGSTKSSSDLWGSTFDSTKIVYLSTTTYTGSHSWMILRSPSSISSAGYLYLLLAYGGNGTETNGYAGIFISNTPFTGGDPALRPTSTNEFALTPSSTNSANTFGSTTTGDYKLHMCRKSNGEFWFAASKNTTGKFGRIFGIGSVDEVRSPEAQPWYAFIDGTSNNFNDSSFFLPSNFSTYVNIGSRTHNNLYKSELSVLRPYSGTEDVSSTNSFTRNTTNLQGDLDAFPVYLFYKGTFQDVQGTSVGIKGKVPDVFFSSYLPGSVYPPSGDVEKVCIGSFWLPFDIAPEL
jgi:hypothetical protein